MSADTFTAPAAPPRELEPRRRRTPTQRLPAGLLLSRWAVLGALLCLTAVSVWLRTRSIHFYYWIDEGLSVGIASHPLAHIPGLLNQDGSPPLYYLILHVWMALRGRNEVATHELSLLFSLATIPVAYWAGSSLFDRRTGLVCAVLAAGAPYLTFYGQETRMYALVALLSLLVAAGFVHTFVLRRRRYLPLFSLSLAAALYSHNWALFLGLMCGLAFLWCVRRRPAEGLWRDGLLGFGAVAVLYLPWVSTLLYQARHTGAPWDLPPVIWSLSQGAYFLVGGRGVAVALLLGGGAGLLALRAGAPAGLRERLPSLDVAASRLRLAAEALLILGLGTLLLAWAYSKLTPAWSDRYLGVLVGPLLLLFGLGLARAGRLGMVALGLTACFWLLSPVPHSLSSKSNVAAVAAELRPHVRPDTLVLSAQPEQVPTLAFYLPHVLHFGTPLGPTRDPRVVDWRDALAKLRRSSVHTVLGPMIDSLAPGERVLLVTPLNFPKVPDWLKLITRAGERWHYFLSHDPRLRLVARSYAHYQSAGIAVQGYLYVQR